MFLRRLAEWYPGSTRRVVLRLVPSPPLSTMNELHQSPDCGPLRRVEEPVSVLPRPSDVVTEKTGLNPCPEPVAHVRRQIVPEARVIQERQASDATDRLDPLIPHLPPVRVRVQLPGSKAFVVRSIAVDHHRLMQRNTPFATDIREVAMNCLEDLSRLLLSGVVPGCLVVVHRREGDSVAHSIPLQGGQQRPRCVPSLFHRATGTSPPRSTCQTGAVSECAPLLTPLIIPLAADDRSSHI